MRFRRALIGALVAVMGAVGALAVASPAQAIPDTCSVWGYANGRTEYVTNDSNGGGARATVDLCYTNRGDGYFNTLVVWQVVDSAANGAGATVRMEWTGTDGEVHTYVPDDWERAWTAWSTAEGEWEKDNIKGLYVRACLTNTTNAAHHCGPKA